MDYEIFYTVGKNVPGYMPESDVYSIDNEVDAKMALIDMMAGVRDSMHELESDIESGEVDDDWWAIIKQYDGEIEYLTNIEVGGGYSTILPLSPSKYDLGLCFWINVSDGSEPMPEDEY